MPSAARTLESQVALYRRAATDRAYEGRVHIELEVRFGSVRYEIFDTVLRGFMADASASPPTIVRTVNSIMPEAPATRRHRWGGASTNLVWEKTFLGDRREIAWRRKWPLEQPVRRDPARAPSYRVQINAEEDMSDAERFSSDSNAELRVKNRISFPIADPPHWRADLTVVRQLVGARAAEELRGAVQELLRPDEDLAPEDYLRLVEGPWKNLPGVTFEIELEFVPPEGDVGARDALRPAAVEAVADRVLRMVNPRYLLEGKYQDEIYRLAQTIIRIPALRERFRTDQGLKSLLPQVYALTRAGYEPLYPPTGYFLLDKADGVRGVAVSRRGGTFLLTDRLVEVGAEPSAGRASGAGGTIADGETVVDGEAVAGAAGGDGAAAPVFYAFDVLVVRGENLTQLGYERRVERLDEAVAALREGGLDAHPKPVVRLTAREPEALRVQFCDPVFDERPYQTDGRILVQPGKPYRETKSYKWKSLWDTTIDFLAKRAPDSVLRSDGPFAPRPKHTLYFLFVGISPDLFERLNLERAPGYAEIFPEARAAARGGYFPIQFALSYAPYAYLYYHPRTRPAQSAFPGAWPADLDGRVVELGMAAGRPAAGGERGAPPWRLSRVREDRARDVEAGRYFGNDYRIAELTWTNYVDPFDEELLWTGPSAGYFASSETTSYKAQRAFASFVKSRRIRKDLSRASFVVDLAIGRGQDLGRYIDAQVSHVVGIDRDPAALAELVRRKYDMLRSLSGRRRGGRGRGRTVLYALRADLGDPAADTARRVRGVRGFPEAPGGADAVVCNFAFHYFVDTSERLRNFILLCRAVLKKGGLLIITGLLGGKVFAKLEEAEVPVGESWDLRVGDVVKYSVRRDYAEDTLTPLGQKIGVILPFSRGEYYPEYLVNVEAVVGEFVDRGFERVGVTQFSDFFTEFESRNPGMYGLLAPEDLEYLGLHGEILLRKKE